MARNGSGVYSLPAGNPVTTATTISSTWANNTLSDIATALTASIAKDGQTSPTANLPMGSFVLTGLGAGTLDGHSLRYEQLFSQGAPTDIASAATTDIGAVRSNFLTVTGTTGITSLGTNYNGPKMLRFAGALTLTHNATTLVLPGATNLTTVAGDTCIAIPKSTASGTADGWNIVLYSRAAGYAESGANGTITSLTALTSVSGNPAFGGAPTSTTPAASDTTTKIATMAAVNSTGRVVQTVEATPYVTYTSTAVALPYDDTIPQNTEGLELITVTITPKSASNRLRIEFDASMNASTSVGKISVALFQDSTASAIAAQGGWGGDNTIQYKAGIVHEMAAGTTSATTFKIRFGADAGTAYVNGTNATRRFGGVQAARLKVTELAA